MRWCRKWRKSNYARRATTDKTVNGFGKSIDFGPRQTMRSWRDKSGSASSSRTMQDEGRRRRKETQYAGKTLRKTSTCSVLCLRIVCCELNWALTTKGGWSCIQSKCDIVDSAAPRCCCCCCCWCYCCCRYKISNNAKYCRHFVKNVCLVNIFLLFECIHCFVPRVLESMKTPEWKCDPFFWRAVTVFGLTTNAMLSLLSSSVLLRIMLPIHTHTRTPIKRREKKLMSFCYSSNGCNGKYL